MLPWQTEREFGFLIRQMGQGRENLGVVGDGTIGHGDCPQGSLPGKRD